VKAFSRSWVLLVNTAKRSQALVAIALIALAGAICAASARVAPSKIEASPKSLRAGSAIRCLFRYSAQALASP